MDVQSTGETFQEAYEGLREAMEGWIEIKLANRFPILMPRDTEGYSGKFVLCLPIVTLPLGNGSRKRRRVS